MLPHANNVGSNPHLNPKLQDVYLHTTLQQIDYLANEDVEMKAPLSDYANFVVIDTNILLHNLEVLQQFADDIEELSLPTIILVPGIVIHELDRQKKEAGLGFFARRGSSWLLEKVSQRRAVKCQADHETCKSTGSWKKREYGELMTERTNDGLILDCCIYFSLTGNTVLCSADNNLCVESESTGIRTIVPRYHWCSRDIARGLFGDIAGIEHFGIYKEYYRRDTMEDDDADMIVDDDADNSGWTPQHPLNLLHEAVVDHFSRLLTELVGRVGGQEVRQETSLEEDTHLSQHAPRRRHYSRWSVSECIGYLNDGKSIRVHNPPAERFLVKVELKRSVPYARRGWEWSRRDWEVALGNLRETAMAWGDVSIPESLYYLQPHIEDAFA